MDPAAVVLELAILAFQWTRELEMWGEFRCHPAQREVLFLSPKLVDFGGQQESRLMVEKVADLTSVPSMAAIVELELR